MVPISELHLNEAVHLPVVMSRNEETVKQGFWPKLIRALSRVPFAEDLVAAYYCAFDPKTPLQAKAVLLAALAYFVLPIDGIPDFIAGLGFTDDMAVIIGAVSMISRHITAMHRSRAKEILARMRQENSIVR